MWCLGVSDCSGEAGSLLMGEEAPESFVDFHNESLPSEHEPKASDCQTAVVFNEKIYVVGGSDVGAKFSVSIKIFDKLSGIWIAPTILGTRPSPSKVHSAISLNKDRILILKRDSPSDDCIWFLEVDTPFVKEQKKIMGTEVVAWSKGVLGDGAGAMPVVITGPSGVGKGTLISKLMKDFPSTFGFSVSHTTRAPREKEVDGVHYHFSERSIMEKDIREGKFLESALVHGNLYGTSIEAVEVVTDAGKRCILDIDVQGARSVRASSLEAMFIFICPPSFEELEKRLRARGTETEEQIQKRLRNARAELEQGKSPGLFDHLLVNDDLESCYLDLQKILALDMATDASYQPSMKNFRLSPSHSVCKRDQKVMIHCASDEFEIANPSLFELDLSSLKGGAPGRTRGLKIYSVDS